MHLDKNPYFRKVITPWYDSNFACWILLICMCLIFIFGITGIIVASTTPEFQAHTWFPLFLSAVSLFLAFKLFFRLRKRSINE